MTVLSNFYKPVNTSGSLSRSAVIIALAAAFMLLIPLIAMQYETGENWSPFDFAVAWTLLFSTGFTYKLVLKKLGNNIYRLAVGASTAAALFMVWSNLAVGLVGSENNPANLMYFGVLAVGLIAALIARFQPQQMKYVLLATAAAQILVAFIELLAGTSLTQDSSLIEVLGVNGFFTALWLGSALLFRYAEHKQILAS